MWFKVSPERAGELERLFRDAYLPALRRQAGFRQSRLLRAFEPGLATFALPAVAGAATFNYVVELTFDSEEQRRAWARTREHAELWPALRGMADEAAILGFHVAIA
jgi:heme-degrading monooxygenase HmoA